MSGTRTKTMCPCCHAALRSLPEFAYCPACGLIATDVLEAFVEIAELEQRLADRSEINLDGANCLAVLNEGAWWELCDGHAVYFTAGSLSRLVRRSRFDVIELSLSDDERRVHLKAKPAEAPTRPSFDLEDDLAAVTAAVNAFPAAMERQVARWRRVIEETLGEGKRITIRGPEAAIDAFLSKLQIAPPRLARVIDASCVPDVVIALGDAVAEVRGELRRLGLRPLVLTP
jgi:hypothetical protein